MDILLVLPILIPFLSAIIMLLAWDQRRIQGILSLLGTGCLFIVAILLLAQIWQNGIQAAQMGNWPAPFGITLVADLLSAVMIILSGTVGLTVAIYSLSAMDEQRKHFGFYPLFFILLMGINGAFLTGDMFNLYVWFEVMLIASFGLTALGGTEAQLTGAFKYVALNLMASAIFLSAVGILYGIAGTLNMADLAQRLQNANQLGLVTTVSMLFLVAFGIKAALFPLFFWLPASYHTPPVPISAIFAGLLTKVGVYALIRVFTLIFIQNIEYTHFLLLVISGFTMLTGVLGAASQNQFRRILSFHSISQIGYMIMGLALWTPLALAGSILYIIHHAIVKTSLFLVAGIVRRMCGTENLKYLGGLYRSQPFLAGLFLIPALSLAGIPPFSGFWAKFTLVQSGLQTGQYAIIAVSLVVGLLTLFSMTKIWTEVFWKDSPEDSHWYTIAKPSWVALVLPAIVLVLITVILGLATEPLFQLSMQASEQLLNPSQYIDVVLKSGGQG